MHAPIAIFALGCNPIQRSTLGYRTDRESRTSVMVTMKNKRLAKNWPVPKGIIPLIPVKSGGGSSTEPIASMSQLVTDFVDFSPGGPQRIEILNQVIHLVERGELPTLLELKKLVGVLEYKAFRQSFESRLLGRSKERSPLELAPYLNLVKQADDFYKHTPSSWQSSFSTGPMPAQTRKCQACYQEAIDCLVGILARYPGANKFLDRQVEACNHPDRYHWNATVPRLIPARSRKAVERVEQDARERRELIVTTLNVSVTRLKSS